MRKAAPVRIPPRSPAKKEAADVSVTAESPSPAAPKKPTAAAKTGTRSLSASRGSAAPSKKVDHAQLAKATPRTASSKPGAKAKAAVAALRPSSVEDAADKPTTVDDQVLETPVATPRKAQPTAPTLAVEPSSELQQDGLISDMGGTQLGDNPAPTSQVVGGTQNPSSPTSPQQPAVQVDEKSPPECSVATRRQSEVRSPTSAPVTIEALLAENQRLREEVERQRKEIEELKSARRISPQRIGTIVTPPQSDAAAPSIATGRNGTNSAPTAVPLMRFIPAPHLQGGYPNFQQIQFGQPVAAGSPLLVSQRSAESPLRATIGTYSSTPITPRLNGELQQAPRAQVQVNGPVRLLSAPIGVGHMRHTVFYSQSAQSPVTLTRPLVGSPPVPHREDAAGAATPRPFGYPQQPEPVASNQESSIEQSPGTSAAHSHPQQQVVSQHPIYKLPLRTTTVKSPLTTSSMVTQRTSLEVTKEAEGQSSTT